MRESLKAVKYLWVSTQHQLRERFILCTTTIIAVCKTIFKLPFSPNQSHAKCSPLATVSWENNLGNCIVWSFKCVPAPGKTMQQESCEQQDKGSAEILWLQVMYCGTWMSPGDSWCSLKPDFTKGQLGTIHGISRSATCIDQSLSALNLTPASSALPSELLA